MRAAVTQVAAVGLRRVAAATMKWHLAALAQRLRICLHKVELVFLLCAGVVASADVSS